MATEASAAADILAVDDLNQIIAVDKKQGLRIITTSFPSPSPTVLGSYKITGQFNSFDFVSNYLMGIDSSNLKSFTVQNSNYLTEVNSQLYQDTRDIAISGGYAYLADGIYGLHILNISTPSLPVWTGYITGLPEKVVVYGSYAYVIDYRSKNTREIRIIDVSNPAAPTQAGTYNVLKDARDLSVYNPLDGSLFLLVSTMTSGLRVLDITDPTAPSEVANFTDLGRTPGVMVQGHYAYLADSLYGLRILDIVTTSKPVLSSYLACSTQCNQCLGTKFSGFPGMCRWNTCRRYYQSQGTVLQWLLFSSGNQPESQSKSV